MAATRQDRFHLPPIRLAARAFTIAPKELPVIGAGRHLRLPANTTADYRRSEVWPVNIWTFGYDIDAMFAARRCASARVDSRGPGGR
jgi:hypothetical protein